MPTPTYHLDIPAECVLAYAWQRRTNLKLATQRFITLSIGIGLALLARGIQLNVESVVSTRCDWLDALLPLQDGESVQWPGMLQAWTLSAICSLVVMVLVAAATMSPANKPKAATTGRHKRARKRAARTKKRAERLYQRLLDVLHSRVRKMAALRRKKGTVLRAAKKAAIVRPKLLQALREMRRKPYEERTAAEQLRLSRGRIEAVRSTRLCYEVALAPDVMQVASIHRALQRLPEGLTQAMEQQMYSPNNAPLGSDAEQLAQLLLGVIRDESSSSCGLSVIQAISQDSTVTLQSLKAFSLQLGESEQDCNDKGTPVATVLGMLAERGWHQARQCNHRGEQGFCGTAIGDCQAYIFNDATHWSALVFDVDKAGDPT
jgi:hypothetical protein